MGILRALIKWSEKKKKSDIDKITITSNGAFFMKAEDLFDNKEEALNLLKKLNDSVRKYKRHTHPEVM